MQVLQNQQQQQFVGAKKYGSEQHLSDNDTTMETNSDHSAENYVPQYDNARVEQILKMSAQTVDSLGSTIEKVNQVQDRIREVVAGCHEVFAQEQRMQELVEQVQNKASTLITKAVARADREQAQAQN